jgi:hypothetical protein
MFLLEPFRPPMVSAPQMCGPVFPSNIWSVAHFWIPTVPAVGVQEVSLGHWGFCPLDQGTL